MKLIVFILLLPLFIHTSRQQVLCPEFIQGTFKMPKEQNFVHKFCTQPWLELRILNNFPQKLYRRKRDVF